LWAVSEKNMPVGASRLSQGFDAGKGVFSGKETLAGAVGTSSIASRLMSGLSDQADESWKLKARSTTPEVPL